VGGLVFLLDRDDLGDDVYHCFYDGNGNLTSLRDANQAIAAQYDYGPFGELLTARGDYAAENPYRFSTKYVDAETGLYYYGYRYYNSSTGRWLSRDPIGEEGGLNLYGFVGNQPVSLIDSLGDSAESECGTPRLISQNGPALKIKTGYYGAWWFWIGNTQIVYDWPWKTITGEYELVARAYAIGNKVGGEASSKGWHAEWPGGRKYYRARQPESATVTCRCINDKCRAVVTGGGDVDIDGYAQAGVMITTSPDEDAVTIGVSAIAIWSASPTTSLSVGNGNIGISKTAKGIRDRVEIYREFMYVCEQCD
jgi:RHS repeat-associated protein